MIETPTIEEKFNHLLKLFSSKRFLKKEGPGNDIPFFICPFSPKDAVEMKRVQKQLVTKLGTQGIQVLTIDLYLISLELLKLRGIFDEIIGREKEFTKDELLELLQNTLDPENELVPYIADLIKKNEHDIIFISGVGEVYPYIRSHNVLNNLQKIIQQSCSFLATIHTL